MKMISTLAVSRIKYNRSRSILTAVSIMLTTILLMGVGTCAVGLMDLEKQQAVLAGNTHASISRLDNKQIEILRNHMDVEAITVSETFATVEYEKMNGFLTYSEELKDGIYQSLGNIIEGHRAEAVDEICGPKVFFERMGVDGEIGNKITIPFRVNGKGMIQTREFTICGLVSQRDVSDLGISDSRIAYGASISEALINEYLSEDEREYGASIRVYGEDELSYNEIKEKIETVVLDIGSSTDNLNLNRTYLWAMTEPDSDMIAIVVVISLMIIVFSTLVIYSIYYVSVITDVQEIGKLKALGASNGQIRRLLLSEGMRISALAIPIGLILGYFIPYLAFPLILSMVTVLPVDSISMFSLPVLLVVAAAVLITVVLSLLKPMRMAAKVSPMEAIRYQESSGKQKMRKGNININLFKLSAANLLRNKKRTIVTMTTMGLSCVLFMSIAGVMSSMRDEDIARRNIPEGDFRLSLDFSANDREYPENNLDSLQQENIFNDEFIQSIKSIDGVEGFSRERHVLVDSDFLSVLFDEEANGEYRRIPISCMDREKAKKYQSEVKRGELDYDKMVAQNGAVFGTDVFFDDYGFKIGDIVPLNVYDGNRQLSLTVQIMATVDTGERGYFIVPEEVWNGLGMQFDTTTDLYINVNKAKYDNIKTELEEITDTRDDFILYSMDEEMKIGKMSVGMVKYPMYLILIIIAVIGFMNLINTMITSIVTRKRELGILQAVGLSDRQLTKMLTGEGMVFTAGTLLSSVTLGNFFGYLIFLWAKESGFMSVSGYHYPFMETVMLALVLIFGQLFLTHYIGKRVHKESLIDRIRSSE